MTIITKNQEKAPEKVVIPLVVPQGEHNFAPSAPLGTTCDGHTDNESIVFYRNRMSASATVFIFFAAISVMLLGVMGGVTIYRYYRPTLNRMHFRGMCDIPYDSQSLVQRPDIMSIDDFHNLFPQMNFTGPDFFREEYELDLSDDESYAKINVPDFQDGRRGRFIHDFKENQSVIVDSGAYRCFVMPLDREHILPPKSFLDLIEKLKNGYYDIDTQRVRQNWRVMTPAVLDPSEISPKVALECIGMRVYKLEKYVNGVFKRSTKSLSDSGKYAEFAGNHIVEMNLVNIHEIEEMEKKLTN